MITLKKRKGFSSMREIWEDESARPVGDGIMRAHARRTTKVMPPIEKIVINLRFRLPKRDLGMVKRRKQSGA